MRRSIEVSSSGRPKRTLPRTQTVRGHRQPNKYQMSIVAMGSLIEVICLEITTKFETISKML